MADKVVIEKLRRQAWEIRKELLRLCNHTLIHIGGDLSATDIMTVIWQYALKFDLQNPKFEGRDRFVLSKGHAAALVSFCQAMRGCYDIEQIHKEYATDFGRFGMHSCNLCNPYVEVSTGSLGHGFPIASGIAKALKMKGNKESRVYVVMGDGELNEGTMWESAMLAPQLKLGNLVGFVDRNRMQFDGQTEDIIDIEPLVDKWKAFRWNVKEVDGHDLNALVDVVDSLPDPASDVPTIIICNTVKGKKVSFMENVWSWHAGQLSDEDYRKAIADVNAAYERGE